MPRSTALPISAASGDSSSASTTGSRGKRRTWTCSAWFRPRLPSASPLWRARVRHFRGSTGSTWTMSASPTTPMTTRPASSAPFPSGRRSAVGARTARPRAHEVGTKQRPRHPRRHVPRAGWIDCPRDPHFALRAGTRTVHKWADGNLESRDARDVGGGLLA